MAANRFKTSSISTIECVAGECGPGSLPAYNLRGQFTADAAGRFEFETVVPSPYTVPDTGATGQLLAALGRVPWRPAHVHFKITHPDAQMLTTQIYFEGDPWIDEDVVGAVKAR